MACEAAVSARVRKVTCNSAPGAYLDSYQHEAIAPTAAMAPQQPKYFDPQEREREKQASREADERAFAAGESGESIDARNAFLTADRTIVHWDPSRPF